MRGHGAADRGDIARLALKVAEEFDKALRGEAADQDAITEFTACLQRGREGPSPARSMFLHNHRTIGAFSRAWQRAYNSPIATVDDLNARVSEKVREATLLLAQPASAEESKKQSMKRFFLSLHRELLMQQFPPRPVRRARVDEESMHG